MTKKINFIVDPIQDYYIKQKMMESESFARALNKNMTSLLFDYIKHKVKYKEMISIEVRGQVRSGKSTTAIALAQYISSLTHIPFKIENLCPNETIYLQKLRSLDYQDNSVWVVDEQKETHVGAGAFAEMQVLQDITQITAKKNLHTIWVHPEFVGRGSDIGLETWGKDMNNFLVRCIMYNLSPSNIMKSIPIGVAFIPILFLYPCHESGYFGHKTIDKKTGNEVMIFCNKNVCPRYEKCNDFMALYEKQKDEQIDRLLSGDFHDSELARIEVVKKLMGNDMFANAKTKKEKKAIARMLVPYGTPEKMIDELVVLASSENISIEELEKIVEKERQNKNFKKI